MRCQVCIRALSSLLRCLALDVADSATARVCHVATNWPYRDRMNSSERSEQRTKLSRRQVLGVAGGAGLAAAGIVWARSGAGAPSKEPLASAAPSSTTPPAPSNVVAPPPPPPPTAHQARMLCRQSWNAQPPLPGGRLHTISRMTLHHTAVTLGDNSNAPARLRQHQAFHQGKGWIDIAYHVSVDRNGNIYQLRTPDYAGDTATNYDPAGHFLVLCEGNFDEEMVTDEQLHGAATAFAWAVDKWDIPVDTLGGHRDAPADTSCPGTNLYSKLTSGELTARIKDLLNTGGVDLQTICGPEAAAVVAAIESGLQPLQ